MQSGFTKRLPRRSAKINHLRSQDRTGKVANDRRVDAPRWVEIASTCLAENTTELIRKFSLQLRQRLEQWIFLEPPRRKDLAPFEAKSLIYMCETALKMP